MSLLKWLRCGCYNIGLVTSCLLSTNLILLNIALFFDWEWKYNRRCMCIGRVEVRDETRTWRTVAVTWSGLDLFLVFLSFIFM
jgi:hypothetical protein